MSQSHKVYTEMAESDLLISDEYLTLLREMHAARPYWGNGGHKYADEIRQLANDTKARTILDYGCGIGTLALVLRELPIAEYDPGVIGKEQRPKPADIVVATDVLEHIETGCIDFVIRDIFELTRIACFMVICVRPATTTLPNGHNAHLIIHDTLWWGDRLRRQPWNSIRLRYSDHDIAIFVASKL